MMKIRAFFNGIILAAKKDFGRSEALALATVNSTLIAVLLACVSAYIVYKYTIIQNAELKAIEEAERINNIDFVVRYSPFRAVDSSEVFNRKKLIEMMQSLMMGQDDDNIPNNIDGKAKKAFGIMSALVNQYPYPESIFKTKDGRFASRSNPMPLSFANLDEVNAWINEMDDTISIFSLEIMNLPGHLLVLIREFAKGEFVAQLKKTVNESPILLPMTQARVVPRLGIHVTKDSLDPILTYNDFLNGIAETGQIIKSTSQYVKRAEALRKGYASKSSLKSLFILSLIAFCCGVVYPLSSKIVKQSVALWIPLSIYFTIGILTLSRIL